MANDVAIAERRQQVAVADEFKNELTLQWPQLQKMLPAHVDADKFQGMVISVVTTNPKLLECTRNSLMRSVADAADLGLSLNPQMREADILPVYSQGKQVAQCRPRAIGLMKLARNSGEVTKIAAHEVYENDEFDVEYGIEEKLIHKPMSAKDIAAGKARGKIIAGYCIWKLKDGTTQFEVVDRARIDRSRNASEGYKYALKNNREDSVWHLHEAEMVRKTAVRAAAKYMPLSNESDAFRRALALDNEIEGDFEEVKDDPAADGDQAQQQQQTAGAAQVQALEQRIGASPAAAGPAATAAAPATEARTGGQPEAQQGPSQTTAPAAARQGHGSRSTRGRNSAQAETPTPAAQGGSAATAGASDGPQGPEPPPRTQDDFDPERDRPAFLTRTGAAAQGRVDPRNDQMAELKGDDPATIPVKIDWGAKAREIRDRMKANGDDIALHRKLVDETKPLRDRMKVEAPDWWDKLQTAIEKHEKSLAEW